MHLTTTDLYESSFLHCRGAKLARAWVDRGRRRKTVVFLFEGNGQLTELQTEYHTGKATVNLTEYRASLEELKETMFRLIRGNQGPNQNKNQNRQGGVCNDSRTVQYKAVNH